MIESTPTVRRFAANEWRVYRALRLHALRDAPDAFGSTLAREEAFPDDEWVQRLEFYRGLGFVEVGTPEPLRSGSTSRKQTMRRTL